MSDDRDDKLNTHQTDGSEYSVEEILSEFSSSRNASRNRVVPFPTERTRRPLEEAEKAGDLPGGPEPVPSVPSPGAGRSGRRSAARPKHSPPEEQPQEPKKTAEIIDLPPESLTFALSQKVRGLFRQAEEYADQMYQQAEPTPEELEAEQYIPGVDVEETPAEDAPRRPKPKRAPPKPPKDVPPADLAARYGRGVKSTRLRVGFGLVLSLLCAYLSCNLPLPQLPWEDYSIRLLGGTILLGIVMLLCIDVLGAGLLRLLTARPCAETLAALAALFTLADALTMPLWGTRGDTLPYTAAVCFTLVFALWGRWDKQRGDRLSCRTAAQARSPYVVTLDDNKWSGRPGYCKWSGSLKGFGSQIQMPDGVQQVYRIAAPLLILACLLLALLASVGRQVPAQFLWAASALFTGVSSFSALLAYGMPYHNLALRLSKIGAALAGWAGADRCGEGSIVLTDTDLFPPGSVKLNGIKVFGDFSNERVVAYASTLIRCAQCGLEKPFSDLMKAQNAMYRTASDVRFHEGGITGVIRGQEVIVGTASFMHLMNIAMPQGLNVKNAVFCAIDGDLAGIFALHYAMQSAVAPCLTTLMRNKIAPLLATRDPNLIPSLLGQKFKLPVDKMEFPSVDRRLELSDDEQEHDSVTVAVLCREGLGPYCDAAVGAKRLRTAVRLGALFSVLGSCVGLILTFYLTFVDAYQSLSPAALLVFLFAWLVPALLLSDWANRY